jgi:ABC-type sugar transport system ATPase subunit
MCAQQIVLEIKNIIKRFPGITALDYAQLTLHKGEVMGLIGENGAGKSTLMNIVLGSIKPDEGEMYYKGVAYNPKSTADALKKGISMIHQELTLVSTMTVAENIWIGREDLFSQRGIINNKKRLRTTNELLSNLDIQLDAGNQISTLSVANMQLVEVARAVSYNSDIIIMDEPTSALTNIEIDKLYAIIKRLRRKGTAVIFISHKIEELFEVCETITVLRDGKYINCVSSDSITKDELVKLMVGRDLNNYFPKEHAEIGEVIFEVKNLNRYGYFKNVSFKVRKGEILGLCGLMGAGRTEIIQAIFGIDKLESGEIYLNGKKTENLSVAQAIKNKIAMVTEDRLRKGIIHRLSARHNISLAYLNSICRFGFINIKKEKSDCERIIEYLCIRLSDQSQEAGTLSGGNQQKLIIGKWLLTDPDVYILDEPTRGIDVGSKVEIYKLISTLAKSGKAIILVSSELPEIIGISDRILVVRHGEIVSENRREEFNQETLMKSAFGTC